MALPNNADREKGPLGHDLFRATTFPRIQQLRDEYADLRAELAARKWIERAKGRSMGERHLIEDEAYNLLRRMANDRRLKLVGIAQRIVEVDDLDSF